MLLSPVVLVIAFVVPTVVQWTFPKSIYAHSIVTVPFHADEMR